MNLEKFTQKSQEAILNSQRLAQELNHQAIEPAHLLLALLRRVQLLMAESGYRLEVTPEARQYLAEAGYDPDFGARPLKRAIQRQLQDPLALSVLSGEFSEGDLIRVERGPEGLEFRSGFSLEQTQ